MKENSIIKAHFSQTNRVNILAMMMLKRSTLYRLPERSELSADINESLVVEFIVDNKSYDKTI